MWTSQREAVERAGYETALPDLPGPEAEALADRLMNARLVRVPGGHLPPLEQGEEFNRALLEFLADVAP